MIGVDKGKRTNKADRERLPIDCHQLLAIVCDCDCVQNNGGKPSRHVQHLRLEQRPLLLVVWKLGQGEIVTGTRSNQIFVRIGDRSERIEMKKGEEADDDG
jgi:hypothetical protein